MPRSTPVKALYAIPHKIKYIIVQLGVLPAGANTGNIDNDSTNWGVGFDFEVERLKVQITTAPANIPITAPGQGVYISVQQTEDWEYIFVENVRPFFVNRAGVKQFDHIFHLPRRMKIYEGNKIRTYVENRTAAQIGGSIFIYGWLVK